MNEEIKSNLEYLFNINYNNIKSISFEKIIDDIIIEEAETYTINVDDDSVTQGLREIEITKLLNAKNNSELITAFENVKKMKFDEKEIIAEFKTEILNSITQLRNKIDSENKGFKNQIIFLEYDYEPRAYFCGFGKGDYPILKKPEYFEFNFREELYAGIGKVDYSKIWKKLTSINEILEDIDIDQLVWESELYQNLRNSIKFKTYLLLNKAFEEIGIKSFKGIEIEKPLMIYGNERICEPINIYSYE
ncbi:hypothetical protein [Polaribacter sp. NJDZ03]|uniref:hypothetical protein n=1 Tax=Polaribacter sp. NJDZ03 TaxID=2855841 RepID=UPI001C4A4E1A|nr:hypothetical protein [Polaribacter sp. NJDZ03]